MGGESDDESTELRPMNFGYLVGRSVEKGSSLVPSGGAELLEQRPTLLGFEEFTKRPPKSDADVAVEILIGRERSEMVKRTRRAVKGDEPDRFLSRGHLG